MTPHWHNIVGMIGVAMIVVSYALLQGGYLRAEQARYSLANAAGAALVIFSLIYDFNLSAFVVEFFWLLISLYGLWRARPGRPV